MDEQQQQEQQLQEQQPAWGYTPTKQDRTVQVATFLTGVAGAGVIDLVVHGGLGGLVFGAAAAFILAKSAPDAYAQVKDVLPWARLQETLNQREPGGRSIADRMMGRHEVPPAPESETARIAFDAGAVYDPRMHTQHLYLSPTLFPHANDVLSNRIAILGMPNAGKSNTVAVLIEELARFGGPLIVFDLKPEYGQLCSKKYLVNPFRASVQNVSPQNAFAFGKQIMRDRLQVVLDLRSYMDDDAAALVMIGMIDGVYSWQAALRNEDRLPCMFVLEEAHYWLSQGQPLNSVSRKENKATGKSLYATMQSKFFSLISIGRSFGMGSIVSTQRSATLDKRAIAPMEWKILLKANDPNDLETYAKMGLKDSKIAMGLGRGEAYVIGPGEYAQGSVHQFRVRNSPDDAKTPGLEALQKSTSVLADVDNPETYRAATLAQQQAQQGAAPYSPDGYQMPQQPAQAPSYRSQQPAGPLLPHYEVTQKPVRYPPPEQRNVWPVQSGAGSPVATREAKATMRLNERDTDDLTNASAAPPAREEQATSPALRRYTASLTERERQVLEVYEPGLSPRNIAAILKVRGIEISYSTVRTTLQVLQAKHYIVNGQKVKTS